MDRTKVVAVGDVLAEARSAVHGTCSKAVLHQVPEFGNKPVQRKPWGEAGAAPPHADMGSVFRGLWFG